MAIEIVDLPSYKMAIFHSFLYVYQGAVCLENPFSFVFGIFVVHVSSQLTATQPSKTDWRRTPMMGPRFPFASRTMFDVWAVHEMCGTYHWWLIKGHRWYAYHPCCTFTYSYMFGAHVGKYAIHGDNLRSWLCLKMGIPFTVSTYVQSLPNGVFW